MARPLANSPKVTLYTGGFSRFVTSTTAPIATDWSDSCRVGLAPTGSPCLGTAHGHFGQALVGVLAPAGAAHVQFCLGDLLL